MPRDYSRKRVGDSAKLERKIEAVDRSGLARSTGRLETRVAAFG